MLRFFVFWKPHVFLLHIFHPHRHSTIEAMYFTTSSFFWNEQQGNRGKWSTLSHFFSDFFHTQDTCQTKASHFQPLSQSSILQHFSSIRKTTNTCRTSIKRVARGLVPDDRVHIELYHHAFQLSANWTLFYTSWVKESPGKASIYSKRNHTSFLLIRP